MLFNTPQYLLFLLVILVMLWITNKWAGLLFRNTLLLVASYYFYANLHIGFVGLLVYITLVNYFGGIWIISEQKRGSSGKKAVAVSILLSLLVLIFFKYAYFFNDSILLPIGLSFFTFQALSYSIDIYRGKIKPETSFINVALFVAFFPTLLSGPIERARNLLPQLRERLLFNEDNIIAGAKLFIWGLFKKVVIADRLAEYVNMIYGNPEAHTGSTLAITAVFYSFQIYADFSGYADMAIGSGRMMGIKLMENFNLPYCVNSFKEFWRRWHISLTSWFTEYVYISMGGNRVNKARWILNISTVFLLSGVWHGATYSFILWGMIHALLYLLEYYCGPKRPNIIYHLYVFIMITFAWIFFRIEDSGTAWNTVVHICTNLISPFYWGSSMFTTMLTMALLLIFILREYLSYKEIGKEKSYYEVIILLLSIALFGVSSEQFVYFQF